MAEKSRFFNAVLTPQGTPDLEYDVEQYDDYFDTLVTTGVFAEQLNSLEVTGHGSQMKTILSTGKAFIKGKYYENDEALELSHELPDPSQNRIDLVVLRMDRNVENRYIKAFVLTGTPGGTAPTLTQNIDVYEIELAEVLIIAGKSFIETSEITDLREYARYQTKPAWYPEGQVPMDAWMYVHFKDQLTVGEISAIEADAGLMAIVNSSGLKNLREELHENMPGLKGLWGLPGWWCYRTGNGTVMAGVTNWTPIYISKETSFDAYGLKVPVSAAGSNLRGAIYKSENMLPTVKIVDLPVLDTGTTGDKIGLANFTLESGWYFIAATNTSGVNVVFTAIDADSSLGFTAPISVTRDDVQTTYAYLAYQSAGAPTDPAPAVSFESTISRVGPIELRKVVS